jgi:NAD(P)-dependent dehydrogenase (short-subunit alcohol dehydrogenase family)
MTAASPVALVTGANRGIGRELVRQLAERGWSVLLGSRHEAPGRAVAAELSAGASAAGGEVVPVPLDVGDADSVGAAAQLVRGRVEHLDALVNNAGIHYDTWQDAIDADLAVAAEALEVNLLGPWRTTAAFAPLLRRGSRVVNVSSGAGSFAENGGAGGTPAYAVSKAALDMLTVKLAADLRPRGVLVNAVCPGWVATDMGGSGGRPVEQGAASVRWAVELPADGPTGGFFRDGRRIPW